MSSSDDGTDAGRLRFLARLGFGISVVGAVLAFGYFWWRGEPVLGVVAAVVIALAGLWEYRQKVRDARRSSRVGPDRGGDE